MKTSSKPLRIAGFIVLAVSCVLFLLIPVVPWLDLPAGQKAGIATGLLIAGEILFYSSLAILGRSFYDKLKARFRFRKSKSSATGVPAEDKI